MLLLLQSWCQEADDPNMVMSSYVSWWMSCSATTLVSSSWKAKIVFLGPGMCLQWKTTSPILAWHYSQPNWYEPEALAIWWMDWNGLVVIDFIWICLSEFKLIWIVYIPLILEAFGAGNQVLILKNDLLFLHLCYSLTSYTGIK